MDGGWTEYKRSLSGFSGFDSGVSSLKDKVYADKSKVFEMDKLNLGEEATQVGQIKSTLDTVGESAGGLATTMLSVRSFGAMRKHLKNISDKLGGKESNESPGDKNSTQEDAAPAEEEVNPTGDSVPRGTFSDTTPSGQEPVTSIQGEAGDVAPRVPEGLELEPVEMSELSGTRAPEGVDQGAFNAENFPEEEPNMGQNLYHSSVADDPSATAPFTRTPEDTLGTAGEDAADIGADVADTGADIGGEVAADAAEVAADAAVGAGAQAFDVIPVVGEIVGAVVGIGAAIAGGIESGKEAADEKAETEASKAELSIDSASSVANKFGNSVTPTLTSLSQMPSNAGVF